MSDKTPDPMAIGKGMHTEPTHGISQFETPDRSQRDGEAGSDNSVQTQLDEMLNAGALGEEVSVADVERLFSGQTAPAQDDAPKAADEAPSPEPEKTETTTEATEPAKAADAAAADQEADGVLAKDGKTLLPYGVLKGARQQAAQAMAAAQQLKEQNELLMQQLEEAKAGKLPSGDAAAEPQLVSDEQLAQLLESVPDNIGNVLKTLVDSQRQAQQELARVRSQQESDVRDRQMAVADRVQEAIDKLPLLREWQAAEDQTLFQFAQQQDALLKKLPQWADKPMEERFAEVQKLTAQAVGIRAEAPRSESNPSQPSLADKAAKVIAQKTAATAAVPITHSDLPAGAPAAQSEIERVDSLDNTGIERLFAGAKSQEDIERILAKIA
jgi:hypothetical protein